MTSIAARPAPGGIAQAAGLQADGASGVVRADADGPVEAAGRLGRIGRGRARRHVAERRAPERTPRSHGRRIFADP